MEDGMHISEWGTKVWYLDGKLHRLDGPAVECMDGQEEWWLNGKCHRLDGPAIIMADGHKRWYKNGLQHRLDGPAIEEADGGKFWFLNGTWYSSFDEWLKATSVSDDDKLFLKLKWA